MRISKITEKIKDTLEDDNLTALILVGSLQDDKSSSNTWKMANWVAKEMKKVDSSINIKIVLLSKMDLVPGLEAEIPGKEDDGERLYSMIEEADIVVMSTPIWWGEPSSLIQRVIERLDGFDNYYLDTGENKIYGKVFGVSVFGMEDGGQACVKRLFAWASFLGFTIPPEASAMWIGEVSKGGSFDDAQNNEGTQSMVKTMAKNLVKMSKILKANPINE